MGLKPDDDLHLDNPAQMKKFQQGLATQEGAPRSVEAFQHQKPSQDKVAQVKQSPDKIDKQAFAEPTKFSTESHAKAEGVPQEVLDNAKSLVAKGGSSGELQNFMRKEGYPMNGNWCGEFAASVAHSAGIPPPKDAQVASNWLAWGKHVDAADARPGDIAALKGDRHSGAPLQPGQLGGHVGYVSGMDTSHGRFDLLGGNQGSPISHRNINQFEFRRYVPPETDNPVQIAKVRPTEQPTPAPREQPARVASLDSGIPQSVKSPENVRQAPIVAPRKPEPPKEPVHVPVMARGTSPSQQAHDLTPSPRRDPEMSRTIPTHNQELREMSHARAASHEKAAQRRPTNVHHSGVGTNHIPEGSSGKHSTMPYGDLGHFDSGIRDRFLNQYLDSHG